MTRILVLFTVLLAAALPASAGIEELSQRDATGGLREALTKGAAAAVARLGRTDGFLGSERFKIPLPDGLRQAEGALRMMGMGAQADELVVQMNRAAEAAVPEAKALLVDAVRKMSVADAKSILTGGDDAATKYFRGATEQQLTARFTPIVSRTVGRLGLAQRYDALAGRAAALGVVDQADANVASYVTRRALDALFVAMAEEERQIRADPVGAGGRLIGKVFGVLR